MMRAMPALPDDAVAAAGFDPDRLGRLDAFVDAEIAAGRLPGVVLAIARGGDVVRHRAFGYRDPATGVPMTTDTLFWIASMTKPVTTVGALLLHERGLLDLDAEVGEYLPAFAHRRVWDRTAPARPGDVPARPAARQPTVLDLLRHTAGLPEGMLGDTPVHALAVDAVGDGMTALTAAEYAGRLAALPLLHDPGTEWHYGWGLDLVGIVVESLTGERLGEYLHREVLEPLGMTDTTFGVPPSARERYATDVVTDLTTGARRALPDLSVARFDSGGAGLVGTAGDYLELVRMLLARGVSRGRRLLGSATVDLMLSDRLAPGVDVTDLWRPGWNPGYGFGLGVAVRRAGSSGPGSPGEVTWPGAAGTFWWADPAEDLGVVVLGHLPPGAQARVESRVRELVYDSLL
jgi:CubicO group peptidase (beta-lactamase class C family)